MKSGRLNSYLEASHFAVTYPFLLVLVAETGGSLFCIFGGENLESIFCQPSGVWGEITPECIHVLEMHLVFLCIFASLIFKDLSFSLCFCAQSIMPMLSAMQTTSIAWQRNLHEHFVTCSCHLQYTVIAAMLMNILKSLSVSSVGLSRCSAGMIANVFAWSWECVTCNVFYCLCVWDCREPNDYLL